MISGAGMKKGIRKGFTLLELLIVSVIILVLIAMATPLFRRTFTDLELKDSISNLTKFIVFAQQQAIVNRGMYKMSFDFDKNEYRLRMKTGQGEQARYSNIQGRFGRVFKLPRGVSIEGDDDASEIEFYPEGNSDKIEVRLVSTNGDTVTIATTGVLGNVVVTKDEE